jgi:hypothetical protein
MPPGKRHLQVPSQHRVEVRVVAGFQEEDHGAVVDVKEETVPTS